MRKIDLTGKIFGRLLVLEESTRKDKKGSSYWWVQCSCFSPPKEVCGSNLRSGHTQSCGCLKKECKTKHGKKWTPEYSAWGAIKTRCYNENYQHYHRYGGRGIKVCDRWLNSFENFLEDMGERPSEKHSLDRRDNDGNYEPDNCRWATKKEQSRNKCDNRVLTHNGETKIFIDWAKEFNIHPKTLSDRLKSGWSVEKALTKPVRKQNKKKS